MSKYQDPKFDKEDYRVNREAGWRGQGEYPTLTKMLRPGAIKDKDNIWRSIKPAMIGIRRFKIKHTSFPAGRYNPKHRSIRGDILRQLKAEAWDTLLQNERRFY